MSAPRPVIERSLFETEWVHVFEEDGPEGAAYRPAVDGLPLSRRPRQRLSFCDDGSARLVLSGPDDRLHSVAGRWSEQSGEIAVTVDAAGTAARTLRVRVKATDLLVVRSSKR